MKRDRRDRSVDPSAPLLVGDVACLAAQSDDPVSPETIRYWARNRRLRSVKTPGGVYVFDHRDVTEFLRKRRERHSHSSDEPLTAA